MENPDLPHEILLEIFSKLPTKCVGKCRTLSKGWETHLSTNTFVNRHLIFRQQQIQQENLALVSQGPGEALYIITSPTKNDEFFDVKSLTDECRCVLGSCNGLVLVHEDKGLILVNPITLKQVIIPQPEDLGYCNSVVYGFGYDSCSNDYKIVQISSYSPKNKNSDELGTTLVDVYSVKNGVWKRVDGCYPFGEFVPLRYAFEGGAFLNGALHWLVGKRGVFRSCIAVFDLANEVFSEIPLPEEFVRKTSNTVVESFCNKGYNMPRSNGVSVVGGCLLIVDNYGNGVTDVWIMKEYGLAESWVRFSIKAEDGNWHSIVAILCYVGDGELLFLTSWDYLFAYDLNAGTVKNVILGGHDWWFAHGMAFVDSLVSPEGSSWKDGESGC